MTGLLLHLYYVSPALQLALCSITLRDGRMSAVSWTSVHGTAVSSTLSLTLHMPCIGMTGTC